MSYRIVLEVGQNNSCDHCFGNITPESITLVINSEITICRSCLKKIAVFIEDNKTKILSL